MASEDPTIERDDARDRYVLSVGGQRIGQCVYHDDGTTRVLTHTEVAEDHEGEGLGSRLVKFALDDIRSSGMTADPQCPMVAAYIQKHEEYADLVA